MSATDKVIMTPEVQNALANSAIFRMDYLYEKDIVALKDPEIQLSLALEWAMIQAYPAYESAFEEKFQEIHEAAVAEGNLNTISYEEYVESETPKPNSEIRNSQHCHYEIL